MMKDKEDIELHKLILEYFKKNKYKGSDAFRFMVRYCINTMYNLSLSESTSKQLLENLHLDYVDYRNQKEEAKK